MAKSKSKRKMKEEVFPARRIGDAAADIFVYDTVTERQDAIKKSGGQPASVTVRWIE